LRRAQWSVSRSVLKGYTILTACPGGAKCAARGSPDFTVAHARLGGTEYVARSAPVLNVICACQVVRIVQLVARHISVPHKCTKCAARRATFHRRARVSGRYLTHAHFLCVMKCVARSAPDLDGTRAFPCDCRHHVSPICLRSYFSGSLVISTALMTLLLSWSRF